MVFSRRAALTGTAAGVGLAVTGTVPTLGAAQAATLSGATSRPFPPLVDDPAGVLALPAGFKYHKIAEAGVTELDGGIGKTPGRQDGTGVFAARNGRLRLIQNHEITPYSSPFTVPHVAGTVYDADAPNSGGCTVVEVNAGGTRLGEWVGISGTANNCAGGPTPWGSWMTCEEIDKKAGDAWSAGGQSGTYSLNHGYVFEVFADAPDRQLPVPIKAFGRFAHEALVVEPSLRRVYLTEDASGPNGLFYRWTAPQGVKLGPGLGARLAADAGRLEAMKVVLDDGSVPWLSPVPGRVTSPEVPSCPVRPVAMRFCAGRAGGGLISSQLPHMCVPRSLVCQLFR